MSESDENGIWVDGKLHSFDDFTFRERIRIGKVIEEIGGDPDDPADAHFLPACVVVIKNRTDDKYTIDQAMDLKPSDLVKPARPTRRAVSANK